MGGDVLEVKATTASGSHAVITTPAAGKFYRSAGPHAVQSNLLQVGGGSFLEWLPQETIIYDQADVELTTRVEIGQDAGFIGWEMVCLGLPICNQAFNHGRLVQRFEVLKKEEHIFVDTLRIEPEDPLLMAAWGLKGKPVVGTLTASTDSTEAMSVIRE